MLRLNTRRAALLGALALLSAACTDDSPSLPGSGEPPDLAATGGPPSSIATRPRFQLDLQAAGAMRPGMPIQLTVTATGLAATPDAEIELVLPEEASARETGWQDYAPIRGRRIPAAAARRGAVGNGARTTLQHTVTFPEPGLYSVWASARAHDADSIPDVEDGELLLDQAHTVLYLLVDEQGGRVMPGRDRGALPPTAVSSLGPRRDRPGVDAPPPGLVRPERQVEGGSVPLSLQPLGPAPGPRQTSGSVRMVVDYYEASASRFTPVEGAQYQLNFYNSSFAYVGGRGGYVAADGAVTVGCSEAYYAELFVYAYNTRVSVGGASDFRAGQEIDRGTSYPASDCGRTIYTDAVAVPSHVFVNLNKTALGAERHFGRARPRMPAVLTSNTTVRYSTYCPNGTFSGCNFGGEDYLRIQTDSTTGYGQQVWGQNGVFITAHEYGHAYHEKALNGFIRYYSGCGTHSLTTLTASMRCALPEGFADYLAVAARPDETGYDYSWEINYYYTNWLAGQDGSRSEAAIAAFLYDLTDADRWGPEAHDGVAYSGSVIASVISGCQVYEGGYWIYNNGIDHLVYCFERRVDPAVTGSSTYFPTRSPDPTSYAVSSYATDPAAVRRLWLRNLYNQ